MNIMFFDYADEKMKKIIILVVLGLVLGMGCKKASTNNTQSNSDKSQLSKQLTPKDDKNMPQTLAKPLTSKDSENMPQTLVKLLKISEWDTFAGGKGIF